MNTTPARSSDTASGTHPTNSSHTPGRRPSRIFGRWLLSFLGFPIGGYVAILVVGPMDSTATALAGGALTGAVLGLAQAWAFGPTRPHVVTWVLTTAVGLALGLALGAAYGAAATDYATDVTSLVVLGAVTGLSVGITQGIVLLRRVGAAALLWPLVLTGAWALGWLISEAVIGSSVDQHFYIFGSSGAIVVAVLTAPLPLVLARQGSADSRPRTARPARSTS